MKQIFAWIGRLVGLHFCPDNHVVPIFRLGRYHRVQPPGFFWIVPGFERALPAAKTSIHVGNFTFYEVLSQDNIPFEISLTVLFTFNPAKALKPAAAQLVLGGYQLLRLIVSDFTNRRLRRLVAGHEAQLLNSSSTIAAIERDLPRYLRNEMRTLGLAPLPAHDGGVMIKEIVAPEIFKRTMLDVKHDEAILNVLRSYPVPELVQLLNQLIFANSLKDHPGDLSLLMGGPDVMHLSPFIGSHFHRHPDNNGE